MWISSVRRLHCVLVANFWFEITRLPQIWQCLGSRLTENRPYNLFPQYWFAWTCPLVSMCIHCEVWWRFTYLPIIWKKGFVWFNNDKFNRAPIKRNKYSFTISGIASLPFIRLLLSASLDQRSGVAKITWRMDRYKWILRNCFREIQLQQTSIDSTIEFMKNIIYDHFANLDGTINSTDHTNAFCGKYKHRTPKSLKHQLIQLKVRRY